MAKICAGEHAGRYDSQDSVHNANLETDQCRVAVIGIGTAGNNTVTRLMEAGIERVECIAVNTDVTHLEAAKAHRKILIGEKLTKGLGVAGDPKLGRQAAEESRTFLEELLSHVDVVFVTAGLGGGTGTGAAPLMAEIARRKGAITVGVVTTPFRSERRRGEYASTALIEMKKYCDTIVVIDNNKLRQLVPKPTKSKAFKVADQVLANMIKGVVETISAPNLTNLDFADFKTVVDRGGMGIVGVGESDAPNRAEEAVRNALRTPLFDVDYAGATRALVHVTGDNHMTIEEVNRVGELVSEMMNDNALVVRGVRVNPHQDGKLKVTLVMTGVNPPQSKSIFDIVTSQLFNLEPHAEPERSLDIKLDLYQMEGF